MNANGMDVFPSSVKIALKGGAGQLDTGDSQPPLRPLLLVVFPLIQKRRVGFGKETNA